jgi:hypothetical protein
MRPAVSALFAVVLLAVPSAASASQRSGSAIDPAGDSAGFAWQDIISATAQYDTDGELLVAARMNGDLKNGQPATYLQFRVAEYTPPSECTGEGVYLAGFSDDPYNYVKVDGTDTTGSEPIAYNGNDDIVFGAQGSALANKGYSCMTLTVQQKGSDQVVDQLNVPLWFDGYGPSPGTGSSPTGTGSPGGSSATCKAPKVKGKTLKAAKKLIAKAHCKLGKVTKPKHVKKGAHLVVTKQKTKGSSVSLTLGPKASRKH